MNQVYKLCCSCDRQTHVSKKGKGKVGEELCPKYSHTASKNKQRNLIYSCEFVRSSDMTVSLLSAYVSPNDIYYFEVFGRRAKTS